MKGLCTICTLHCRAIIIYKHTIINAVVTHTVLQVLNGPDNSNGTSQCHIYQYATEARTYECPTYSGLMTDP